MSKISYAQKDIRRAYYLESSTLDEIVLAKTFAGGETNVELVASVGSLRVSDRPKYVGSYFYEGRAKLPKIERKLPPLLSSQLSFSELELAINNCDGKYNEFLIGGENYTPFFGETVELTIGLRDVASTYFPVFRGIVHTEGGTDRKRDEIVVRARDEFEKLNTKVPLPKITLDEFLDAPKDVVGKTIPLVLGDWSYGVTFTDSPITSNVDVGGVQVAVKTRTTDQLAGGTVGYYVAGGYFLFSIGGNWEGTDFICTVIDDCVIQRGDTFLKPNFDTNPALVNGYWAVKVNGLIRASDNATVAYTYSSGDLAVIRTKVSCLGTSDFENADANPINLARMFLVTCGRLSWATDFNSTWNTVAAKSSPAQSDFASGIKMRVWVGEADVNVLEYAISLLRQVRCDLYVDKARKFGVCTQHPEDVPLLSTLRHIEPFHVLEDTIQPRTDKKNVLTSADCTFALVPTLKGTAIRSKKFNNNNAISKMAGDTAKSIDLPNLYREADALYQLKEMIRFYSAGMEQINLSVAWVHLNVELGEWVTLSLDVGSLKFDRVPCQVRSISVEPHGGALELELLSVANFAVPNYTPEYPSTNLSSYTQTIEEG